MKLVILTKSAKRMHNGNYGSCVAGINEHGNWIRLVSDYDGDSLSDDTCRAFWSLDALDVDAEPCPIKYQPENYKLIRINKNLGRCKISDVVKRFGVSGDRYCFVNNENRLSESDRQHVYNSLMLIKVQNLQIYSDEKGTKARFTYNDIDYQKISVTDNRHKKQVEYSEAYIVASLPAITSGYSGYYKFIAAVYPN